jgi:hypothetical protein
MGRRELIRAGVLGLSLGVSTTLRSAGSVAAQQEETNSDIAQINISYDDKGYQLLESVTAGWYSVTLTNATDQDVVADIVLLPDGKSVEEFQASLSTKTGGSTIPDWFEQVVFAGGPSASPQSNATNDLQMTPGNWTVLEVGQTQGKSANLTVTEATGTSPTPNKDAAVELQFDATTVQMPAVVAPNAQFWRIANIDTRAHTFALVQLPDTMTYDQVLKLLQTGEPPDKIDMSKAVNLGGIGLLSGGRTIWSSFDLLPGCYTVLDYVPQKDGKTNAEYGQLAVFTVE